MDGRLLKVINILTEELEYSKDLATERKLENLYLKDELDKKDKRISELEMIDRGIKANDILRQVRDGDRLGKVCGDTGAGGSASANGLKYGAAIGAAAGNIVCTPKEELKKEPGKVTPVLKEMEKKLKVFNGENHGDIFKLWGS